MPLKNESLETSERDARPYTPPPHNPLPLADPDAILHRIEQEVGTLHHGWSSVDPHELIRACVKHASCGLSSDARQEADYEKAGTWLQGHEQGIKDGMALAASNVRAVYLVATGEVYEGKETYTRHDALPPLCEAETLYTHPQRKAWLSESIRGDITQVKQKPFAHFKFEPSNGKYSQMPPAHAGYPGVIAAYANPQQLAVAFDGFVPVMAAAGMAPAPGIDSIQHVVGQVHERVEHVCGWARGDKITWEEPPAEELHLYEPVVCSQHAWLESGATHPDDVAVNKFAIAMKAKMARQREKGYSGWETAPIERLQEMLFKHVAKGDPVDVANFAMMLWNRGERTAVDDQWVYDVTGKWPFAVERPA